ncbi:MAG: hypothetical protein ACFFAH_12255 [Promethearchaeota archaeon]
MNKEKKNKIKEYLIVFFVIFVFFLILRIFTPIFNENHPDFSIPNDHYHYINMAKNPFTPRVAIAPFCYRIFVPFIAWLLPFDLEINFQIITYTSIFLTSFLLYELFKNLYGKIFAFTGITLFFSLHWAVRYSLFNIWRVDATAFFFMVLCFYAISKSNLKLYCISLFLGVLTKEIILFTIPVLLIHEYFKNENVKFQKKAFLFKLFLSIAPAILIFIIIRIFIIADPVWKYDYFYLFTKVGIERRLKKISNFDLDFIYNCTLATWGVILCIFIFFNKESSFLAWSRQYLIFICLIYLQLTIATDIERILIAGFYPIILLSLSGMHNIYEKYQINQYYFFLLSIIYFIINLIYTTLFFEIIF